MKRVSNKAFVIGDEVYQSHCDIIIGDYKYFQKFLKKNKINGDEINLNWYAETGRFHNSGGLISGYYIRIPEITFTNDNYETIIHELAHLVFHVLDDRGVKFGADNQEPYTYLLGSFVKQFLEKSLKLYKTKPKARNK